MSWLLINKIIRPPIVIKIANYFQHGAGLERDLRSRIKAQHSTFFLMSFFIIMSPIMVLTWLALTNKRFGILKNNFSSNHSRVFFLLWWWDKFYQEWLRMDRSLMSRSLSLWATTHELFSSTAIRWWASSSELKKYSVTHQIFSCGTTPSQASEQVHLCTPLVLKFIYSEKVKKNITKSSI